MLYVYYLAAVLIFSFWSFLTGKNQQERGGQTRSRAGRSHDVARRRPLDAKQGPLVRQWVSDCDQFLRFCCLKQQTGYQLQVGLKHSPVHTNIIVITLMLSSFLASQDSFYCVISDLRQQVQLLYLI